MTVTINASLSINYIKDIIKILSTKNCIELFCVFCSECFLLNSFLFKWWQIATNLKIIWSDNKNKNSEKVDSNKLVWKQTSKNVTDNAEMTWKRLALKISQSRPPCFIVFAASLNRSRKSSVRTSTRIHNIFSCDLPNRNDSRSTAFDKFHIRSCNVAFVLVWIFSVEIVGNFLR